MEYDAVYLVIKQASNQKKPVYGVYTDFLDVPMPQYR